MYKVIYFHLFKVTSGEWPTNNMALFEAKHFVIKICWMCCLLPPVVVIYISWYAAGITLAKHPQCCCCILSLFFIFLFDTTHITRLVCRKQLFQLSWKLRKPNEPNLMKMRYGGVREQDWCSTSKNGHAYLMKKTLNFSMKFQESCWFHWSTLFWHLQIVLHFGI